MGGRFFLRELYSDLCDLICGFPKSTSLSTAVIRFLSSDRCRTLHSLIDELIQADIINSKSILLDARGDSPDIESADKGYEWIRFDHNQVLEDLWRELNPHAKEWWNLLDISEKKSAELPALPGIEDITRLIFISLHLRAAGSHENIVVVLPHPHHAIRLLGMAQQGPYLIENLLEPLLNWWDNTRKSLSAVETLLRIKLPSSQQLRLSPQWRHNFEKLQTLCSDRMLHGFYLILDGAGQSKLNLMRQLSLCGINAVTPSGLIISDHDSHIMAQIREDLDSSMIQLIPIEQLCKFELKQIDSKNKSNLILNASNQSISIFLPGVDKKELTIKQLGETIFLFYLGQKRTLELPEFLDSLTCQRGQINRGWLTLSFIQQEQHV